MKLVVTPEQYAKLQDAAGADPRSGAYISYGTICNWLRWMGKDPLDYIFSSTEVVVDRYASDGVWRMESPRRERTEEELRRDALREAVEIFKANPIVPLDWVMHTMQRMAEELQGPAPLTRPKAERDPNETNRG